MLKDIVEVRPLEPYRMHIRFEDGAEGIVDLTELVRFEGIFAALKDPAEFQRVFVNREFGVLCWPNGADLDSDVLYAQVTHTPIEIKTLA